MGLKFIFSFSSYLFSFIFTCFFYVMPITFANTKWFERLQIYVHRSYWVFLVVLIIYIFQFMHRLSKLTYRTKKLVEVYPLLTINPVWRASVGVEMIWTYSYTAHRFTCEPYKFIIIGLNTSFSGSDKLSLLWPDSCLLITLNFSAIFNVRSRLCLTKRLWNTTPI